MLGYTLVKENELEELRSFYARNKPSLFEWNFSDIRQCGVESGCDIEFSLKSSHDVLLKGVFSINDISRADPRYWWKIDYRAKTPHKKVFFYEDIHRWRKFNTR